MKKYLRFAYASYESQMMYRGAMLIRGLRDVSGVLFFIVLWAALYKSKAEISGFTFSAMVTYYILVKIIDQIYSYEQGRLVSEDIKNGDLSNCLSKPYSYFFYRIFFSIGRRLARTSTSFSLVVLAFIFLPQWLVFPQNSTSFLFFVISAALSWVLLFELSYLIGLLSFWTSDTGSMRTAADQLIGFLGGVWVPLSLFPKQIADILNILPFKYLYFQLVQIYQGKIIGQELYFSIVIQFLWVIIFSILCRFTWAKGIKNYSAYGK